MTTPKPLFGAKPTDQLEPAKPIAPVSPARQTTFSPVSATVVAQTGSADPEVAHLLTTLNSPTGLMNFGKNTIDRISANANTALEQVNDVDVDFVQNQLASVIATAQSFKIRKHDEKPERGLLGRLSGMIDDVKEKFVDVKAVMLAEFQNVSTQMDTVLTQVEQASERITIKLGQLDAQYQQNVAEYKELDGLLSALKRVREMQQAKVLEKQALAANDPLAAQEYTRAEAVLTRIDKKIDTFERYKLMAIQSAPDIANMQNTAITLVEKFHDIKNMTLPLWKKQMRRYIDAFELRKAANLANTIDDANNAMLRSSSQQISAATLDAARLGERSAIDDATIEEIHRNLINTLTEVATINEQGKTDRANSATKMAAMQRMYANIASGNTTAAEAQKQLDHK